MVVLQTQLVLSLIVANIGFQILSMSSGAKVNLDIYGVSDLKKMRVGVTLLHTRQ